MNRTRLFAVTAAVLTAVAALPQLQQRFRELTFTPGEKAKVVQSSGTLSVEATASHGVALVNGDLFLKIDVRADPNLGEGIEPVRMVLVLDRSGSMAGEKIVQARAAALELVRQLNQNDELGIVAFDSVVDRFEIVRATPENKERLAAFINGVSESGGTNISAGLDAARQLLLAAGETSLTQRVVLVSDGKPTEGVTTKDGLVHAVGRLHDAQVAVSALGVGYDFDGTLMQAMVDRGGGFYAYLNQSSELAAVLRQELSQARNAIARQVVLELELPAGVDYRSVPGRTAKCTGRRVVVPLPDFAPGQSEQIYVQVSARDEAQALDFIHQVRWYEPRGRQNGDSRWLKLTLDSSSDALLSDSTKNEAVANAGVKAVGGVAMMQAAAAFERGDREEAFNLLGNTRRLFAMSADALAGDAREVEQLQQRWENTHDTAAVKQEARGMERKKMLDFGKNNAY